MSVCVPIEIMRGKEQISKLVHMSIYYVHGKHYDPSAVKLGQGFEVGGCFERRERRYHLGMFRDKSHPST